MKPRIFMVSIDEIAANFAFGERFRGEYTREVFIARQQRESEFQSRWPAPAHQTGRILLLDDPFTSMNTVTHVLQAAFGLDVAAASQKSREVHEAGQCVLELSPPANAADTCRRLNASWRATGLPLYCAPQAEKTHA